MAQPQALAEQRAQWEKQGYQPFIIHFSWDYTQDEAAAKCMFDLHNRLDAKGIKGGHGWYLPGQRMMIVIGWSDTTLKIQQLCLAVTFGTAISADVSHAVDIHQLAKALAPAADAKKRAAKPPVKANRKAG